jgi:hypothetical protein
MQIFRNGVHCSKIVENVENKLPEIIHLEVILELSPVVISHLEAVFEEWVNLNDELASLVDEVCAISSCNRILNSEVNSFVSQCFVQALLSVVRLSSKSDTDKTIHESVDSIEPVNGILSKHELLFFINLTRWSL